MGTKGTKEERMKKRRKENEKRAQNFSADSDEL